MSFVVLFTVASINRIQKEVVNVIIGNPAFCLDLYLTGVHFRSELQHVGHVGEQKITVDQSELEK